MRARRALNSLIVVMVGIGACARPSSHSHLAHAETPPVPTSNPEMRAFEQEIRSNDATYVVRYSTRPSAIPANEMFAIDFLICDASGRPAGDVDVRVDAAMPHHGHGMKTSPIVEKGGGGRFAAKGMLFHMSGRWELYFDVRREGVTERAQCEIVLE